MADTTNPTVSTNDQAQDLQINLDTNNQDKVISQTQEISTSQESDLDFDLDLNLSDAPKDDNRLEAEDQTNQETINQNKNIPQENIENVPVVEPIVVTPIIEELFEKAPATPIEEAAMSETPSTQAVTETMEEIPVIEETTKPIAPPKDESADEETHEERKRPSIITEEIVLPPTAIEDINNDAKIIKDMEGYASIGGMAAEAMTENTQSLVQEAPKTFDLDAMLGNPTIATTPTELHPDNKEQKSLVVEEITPNNTQQEVAPIVPPQITTTQATIQKVYTPTTPRKNTTIKIILFVLMFISLGATTFFILKTMYPLEFASIFGGGQTQTQETSPVEEILPIEPLAGELTGTEIVNTEDTGTELNTIDMTGATEIETGTDNTHGSATGTDIFGELDDLGTQTQPEEQGPSDLIRLTEYATQGNEIMDQGKKIKNNKVIAFGSYMYKNSTELLEQIANGEQINNLSGYFEKFDLYIITAKKLIGQTDTGTTASPEISPTPLENDTQDVTPQTNTEQDSQFAPE